MELFDILNEDGSKTGVVKERGVAHREGALHGTVHIWIVRENDKLSLIHIFGQIKDIHLMPEEAYGLPDPNAMFHVEINQLPGAEELEEGQQVYLQNEMGQSFQMCISDRMKMDGL